MALATISFSAKNETPTFEVDDHRPAITFDDWYSHILSHEGGLSNDTDDISLKEYAYHTNKGITESTYKALVDKPTEAGFKAMNEHRDIAMHFWNKVHSDDPKVRAFLAEELWAGGYAALRHYRGIDDMQELGKVKENRYIALSKVKPKYKKGWAKRNSNFIKLLNKFRDD